MSVRTPSRRRALHGALAVALAAGLGGALVSCSEADADTKTHASAEVSAERQSAGERLAALAQRAADTGSLGVVVRIDKGTGKPLEIARQTAWTRKDHHLAAGDQFRVASNTKTMTATLILKEVARHKVSLDDSAEKWLPGVVPGGKDITVRMLLNHTSGLGDYLLTPEFLPSLTGQDKRTWTPEQLLAVTPPQDPPTAPGEKYSYSNANYAALGLILEKATGQSLAELIEEKITKPLGMQDSFLSTDAGFTAGKPHASGYEPDSDRLRKLLAGVADLPKGVGFDGPARSGGNIDTTGINPSWAGAAGGMVSTAKDWQTFQKALIAGKLLPKAQMKQMRDTVSAPEEGGGYGLGLMKVNSPCGTVWGHTGGHPGYSSEIYTDKKGHRSVAVLTTTNFNIKEPKAAAANKKLVDTAICDMLGKPLPSKTSAE
ncbi:serine hydrolase domain-containing protein [Streptomyces tsukubensis]|uniref:Serine hydrolase n=1 Tax=Streptomyces tsukubensis TaxID=83656 RepID=A0A1V4A3I4_9ACTN|nr:serine hydrolase domain-containing protein [Streptomyces tsukubensis]OON74414.1 serine hydrolase [Streptomyces tsukubensis]QFR95347.1 serine hydrolase [Streptomyces tsukubensis]